MVASKILKVCLLLPCSVLNSRYFQFISPYFQKVANVTGITGRSYASSLCYFELCMFSIKTVTFLSRYISLCVVVNVALMQILLLYSLNSFFSSFLVPLPQFWQAKPNLRGQWLVASLSIFGQLPFTSKSWKGRTDMPIAEICYS